MREQYFYVKDQLLLRILRAFAQYTGSLHATGNACIFSLCVDVDRSVVPTSSNPAVPRIAPDTSTHRENQLVVCGLYL